MIIINNNKIIVTIPLTSSSGKIRIKERSVLNQYGIPVATKTKPFTQSCYVEWQIGYDVVTDDADKFSLTTLPNDKFIGANGKEKALYEMSEFIKYFYDWGMINRQRLQDIKVYLESLTSDNFLDNPITHPELAIKRTEFVNRTINGFNFLWSQVEYPLLAYKFNQFEILAEITIREKQRAIGTQPMLYLCFPITELENSENLLGRTANAKEVANFIINEYNIQIFLEMLKLFGTLSPNHNKDIISIINVILQ